MIGRTLGHYRIPWLLSLVALAPLSIGQLGGDRTGGPCALPGRDEPRPYDGSTTVPQLSEMLIQPRIIGPEITFGLADYSIGNLRLDLSAGATFPLGLGECRVGLFFFGKGRFSYASDDPIAAESFRINVRRASQLKIFSINCKHWSASTVIQFVYGVMRRSVPPRWRFLIAPSLSPTYCVCWH